MSEDRGRREEGTTGEDTVSTSRWRRYLKYASLTGEGNRVRPRGFLGYVVTVMAVAITIYALWLGSVGAHPPLQYSIIFLAAILPIAFLTTTASRRFENINIVDIALAVVAFGCCAYLLVNTERYLTWIQGITQPSTVESIVGLVLVALVVEASRRTLGWGLTGVVLALMSYTAFGHLLSGAFAHRPVQLSYYLEQQVFTTTGLFGSAIQVAATYAFLFVFFGVLFQKAGGGQLFFDIAAALTGRMVGGPAKACVGSSGLYGSISGSPTADVATTGQVNIPLMKRVGYTGTFAGAVEATASSGGAILPPVMGAVAFIMAEFTGIAYAEIAQAAILTALLYYFGVFLQVHHRTQKWGMGRLPADQIVGLGVALTRGWQHLIPLVILVYYLFKGYTPSTIAVAATAATLIVSWFKRSTRIGPRDLLDASTTTVFMIVGLGVACAAAGLVSGDIDLTGLAGKFTYLIFSITGGLLVSSLIVAMIVSLLLGLGLPTPAVYIMTAALVAPPLLAVGVPLLETHMFLLYFAALSAISPPIAVAAFTAAPIANANPMKIGWAACRLAIVGFVFPFVFVFRPGLLMQGSALEILSAFVSGAIVAFALAAAVEGWFGQGPLSWWERIILLALGIFVIYPSYVTTIAGAVAIAALLGYRYKKPRWAPEPEKRRPPKEPDVGVSERVAPGAEAY
jgi:TRAP transporter 4TM/12TM fusion protein